MNKLLVGTADKTDFLLQLLAEDFSAGVTVIDPTGDLAEAAAGLLPAALTQRALYFDPTDTNFPIGFNVLESVPETSRSQVAELLAGWLDLLIPGGDNTLTKLYAKPLLIAGLRLLLDTRGTTLLHLMTVLKDASYRERLLKNCTDPVVRETCAAFDDKEYKNAVGFLLSSVRSLYMNPIVRNIVGQAKSTFGRADIVIANLDRAKLGDDTAKLLGGLLIVRNAGQVVIPDYGFFGASVPLAQDRFTLALNFLDELPLTLKQQVLGIEDKYILKTGRRDAEELAFHLGLLNPRILIEQRGNDVFSTSRGPQFSVRPDLGHRLIPLRRRTRACHTRPRAGVENTIAQYLGAAD